MKIIKSFLAMLMFSVILACATISNDVPITTDSLHTKVKVNYDIASVEEAKVVKGIKFLSQPPRQHWVLAGVEPYSYAVGSVREQTDSQEEASIYIFDSAKHRKEGLVDFHKQTSNKCGPSV
jgi:nitrous oxide reductase accessory protein NosL